MQDRRAARPDQDVWLDAFPGVSYQDRWLAADPDSRPGGWCPEMLEGNARKTAARHAVNALLVLGVIRPTLTWLFENKQSRLWREWTLVHDQDVWDNYFGIAAWEGCPSQRQWCGAQHLIRICLVNGVELRDVRGGHVVDYRRFLRATGRVGGELHSMWHYAQLAGLLVGEPDDLGALIYGGQRTPAELVDRYQVTSRSVRNLLVDYLTELSATQDYSSLERCSTTLVSLFWRAIENANPGIDTINLTQAQATAWKTSLRTRTDGNPRRNAPGVLGSVRSFYLDIAAWAHEDPARWAQWAVPCPVSVRDVRGQRKGITQRQYRMQARTRTLAPHLPALAAAAERRHADAVALRELARQAPIGVPFQFKEASFVRRSCPRSAMSTCYLTKVGEPTRIDTDWLVVSTFMTWSIVEVLRHTGVRVEELLELTHLSIRQYRKPDGSVLPLLQIAPSKTDEERILPCSPELTAALAKLVQFASIDGHVPLCVRRDAQERVYSAPLPHLFQLREAGRSRVMSYGTVRGWLIDLANSMDLRDVDGQPLWFTPHDFRRMFITDIVNAGFPIHLAAKLVGHKNLDVTSAYTAVYQTDVFEAYDRFIGHRRQLRPGEEYREPTQQEWNEFVEHFGQRKIALGSCHRPYGSACSHEHACIRCDFLQVDPQQAGRLADIRTNLQAQLQEAERNQWLGDVDQLKLTIKHADRKTAQLRRLTPLHDAELSIACAAEVP